MEVAESDDRGKMFDEMSGEMLCLRLISFGGMLNWVVSSRLFLRYLYGWEWG